MPGVQEAFALLDQYVQRNMQKYATPGLALALTDRERTLRVSTYGFADASAQKPVTPDTLFEIGSITKSFTALALMQQYEAGRLDLHTPVRSYLPWFDVRSDYGPITLHHVMCHTSGIITGSTFTPASRYEVAALRHTEAGFPPDKRFHYSNIGYVALGYVLEDLLGRAYGDVVRSHILGPLGMYATAATITHQTRKRLAIGYVPFYDDRPALASRGLVPGTWDEWTDADGSISSTPGDMAVYLRMLLNRGRGVQGRLLSEESFDLMTQPLVHVWQDIHAGYGIFRDSVDGRSCLSLTGGMIGYQAMMLADPEMGIGALALVNGPGVPWEVVEYALKVVGAALLEQDLPPLPSMRSGGRMENASDYAGTYRCSDRTLTIESRDDSLLLDAGGQRVPLEPRDGDVFYADHPDFELFPLRFVREGGQVVEMLLGPDWYTNDRYRGPTEFVHPPEWEVCPGHYRSHNPWLSNFRVVLRKGELILIDPSGGEEVLVQLADGLFRVGNEPDTPERIQFDTVIDGRALRATRSGCDGYRVSTP